MFENKTLEYLGCSIFYHIEIKKMRINGSFSCMVRELTTECLANK